ncbi:MAG: class I SAM-dependent methyltransferase [Candidatus Brocadiia bacterium]|jgi:predicted amino acid-binding ACT domain protein
MTAPAKQIPSREQEIVLRTLAEAAARPGARFLEVGSWLGESAAILGKVAQCHDGHLFCVDWWKGSPGTELFAAAQREDIFSRFWAGICEQGLENTVVPIRGRSDLAAAILKEGAFDLVFIDGDHRYGGVLRDIQAYSNLVRSGGILCGHDCEGRIRDFERGFLDQGKETDYFQTVHCGVVLAVGETFEKYSINHSIWSVRRLPQSQGWEPTDIAFPGIEDSLQQPPPPLCYTRTYALFRYEKNIYAVPHALLQGLDITRQALRERPEVLRSESMESLLPRLNEPPIADDSPALIGNHEGYNLVRYAGRVYAASVELGPLDLRSLDAPRLNELQAQHMLVVAEDVPQAQQLVDRARSRRLRVEFDEKAAQIGALQAAAAVREADLAALREGTVRKDGEIAALRKAVAEKDAAMAGKDQAVSQLRAALEALRRAAEADLTALRKETERRDGEIAALRKVVAEKEAAIAGKDQDACQLRATLEALRRAAEADLAALRKGTERQDEEIAALRKVVAEKEAAIAGKDQDACQLRAALEALRRASEADLATLRQEMEHKDAELATLWKVIAEKDAEIADKDQAVSQAHAALEAMRRTEDAKPKPGWRAWFLGLRKTAKA